MKILGISNHGLAVITCLICLLWGVIFMERAMNQSAERDYQELRRSFPAMPVSAPSPTPWVTPAVS